MTSALREIGSDEARALLARNLTGASELDPLALHAELIRRCLWVLSRGGSRPVHTLELVSTCLTAWVWPEGEALEGQLRQGVRELCNELADCEDLIRLPQGRWLPAPARIVPLGTGRRLLVGGVPTSALPSSLRGGVEYWGCLRRTASAALETALRLPQEPAWQWSRRTTRSLSALRAWATTIVRGARLLPYASEAWPSEHGFRVYVPALARRGDSQADHRSRWAAAHEVGDGVYFAVADSWTGQRERRVVRVERARVTATALLPIAAPDFRRLMYGLDSLAENPVDVLVEVGPMFRLTLWSVVPLAERRLFAARGRLETGGLGYYPRTWVFPLPEQDIVRQYLLGLGVTVKEADNGTRR